MCTEGIGKTIGKSAVLDDSPSTVCTYDIEKAYCGKTYRTAEVVQAENPNIHDGYFFEANQTWISNRSSSRKSTNLWCWKVCETRGETEQRHESRLRWEQQTYCRHIDLNRSSCPFPFAEGELVFLFFVRKIQQSDLCSVFMNLFYNLAMLMLGIISWFLM